MIKIYSNSHYRILLNGRNGEPCELFTFRRGRRICSTCLLEKEPAMVKRLQVANGLSTDGKESKRAALMGVVPYLKRFQETSGATEGAIQTRKRLETLWKLSQRNARAKHLWKLVGNIELWIAAYRKLAASEGSMTHGGAKGTIDGTSLKSIEGLRDAVVKKRYVHGITRRVNIPKPKGGHRSLGIPEFRDRLVQEVLRTILETIYEPRFMENSHGFRPRRSQHTCLRQIRRDFGGAKWIIEGDISKCFDEIKHAVIRKCLNKTIEDKEFTEFLYSSLKTKLLMPRGIVSDRTVGTPQGGVFSPLICNIVLHQLDLYLSRVKRIVEKGSKRRINPAYDLLRRAGKLGQARTVGASDPMDPGFVRLNYVRYADDFIIGITGPKILAIHIKSHVTGFLSRRLGLELSQQKTLISNLRTEAVDFLGYKIKKGKPYKVTAKRHFGSKTKIIHKVFPGSLQLWVDMQKVLTNLQHKGFAKLGVPVPNFRYLHQTQEHCLNDANAIIRGLANYYKLSDHGRSCINRVSFTLRYSLAKLFAAKFKLKTASRVFAKAGKDLSKPLKQSHGQGNGVLPGVLYTKYQSIPKPDTRPLARKWNPWSSNECHIPYPLTKWTGFSIRGRKSLQAKCAQCSRSDNVEMHHVRALKDLKNKTPIEKAMIASKRKQIPLCRACHNKVHGKSKHK